jgi:hypothetical protein
MLSVSMTIRRLVQALRETWKDPEFRNVLLLPQARRRNENGIDRPAIA